MGQGHAWCRSPARPATLRGDPEGVQRVPYNVHAHRPTNALAEVGKAE